MFVHSAFIHKFLVSAPLHNGSFLHDHYFVCIVNSGKPVGDNDRGPVFHKLCKGILDQPFAFCVQCRGGLVQNKNGGILKYGARNGYPLALSA